MMTPFRRIASLTLAALLVTGIAVHAGQKRQAVSLASGTKVQVRLANQLDTSETQPGQTFSGTIAEPVAANGTTVLARGATVQGRVTDVVSSGRLKRPASITLELTSLRTQPLQIDGKSHLLRNAALIGGGAGAGALIGGATGGKTGAVVGAVIGAGAGTATAYFTGKKEIVLPPEVVLTFVAGSGGAAPAPVTTTARGAPTSGGARGDSGGNRGDARAASAAPAYDGAPAPMFSDRDRQMIRTYYAGEDEDEGGGHGHGKGHGKGLPPGLAKRGGNLPPGLEKQLQRNGTLPPGLQKKVEPFPGELTQRLPRLPSGYSRVIVEGQALILDHNNKILDIMAIVR